MKRLTLVRHAKSSWSNADLADFDRPLNQRGERAAPQMGRHLAEQVGLVPDLIVSSPALRAITTARIVAGELGYPAEAIFERDSIYDSSVSSLVYTVRELPDEKVNVMLFGHMPGVVDLADLLTGGAEISHYPTCGVAMLELNVERWRDTGPECGVLKAFLAPKMLE